MSPSCLGVLCVFGWLAPPSPHPLELKPPRLPHSHTHPQICTHSKEIEDFPARFHAFMAEVKAEHDARAAHAATAQVEEEEDDPEIAPTLANLRSMNINASLGADPEHEPLPPALFHRETSSMMCVRLNNGMDAVPVCALSPLVRWLAWVGRLIG